MRTCTVNGRPGLIVAQNGKTGVLPSRVFVLFDDDRPTEAAADWFDVHSVLPTSVVSSRDPERYATIFTPTDANGRLKL